MRCCFRRIFGVAKYASLIALCVGFTSYFSPVQAELAIEEVIVTAQKRTESLQDVPLAVTALTADMIETNRISSIEDIARLATSVNWQQGLTASNSTVSMRGFGTNAFGIGIESSVGIVQDGVVLSRQNEAFGDLFNLERVEVLRGPQGTLFGKNASAGVIHVITKDPSKDDLEGKADLYYGSFDEFVARGTVSGPLTESGSIAGRVTGFYKTVDGNINNAAGGKKLNGIDDSFGIRTKLAVDVSDKLELMIIGDYSDTKTNCCGEAFRFLPANTNVFGIGGGGFSVNTDATGLEVSEKSRDASLDAPTFGNYSSWGISAEANYDLEWAMLTSITSYREWVEATNADIDFSSLDVFQINGGSKDQNTFTQELRLTSSSDSPFQYVAGLFYYNNDTLQDFNRTFFNVLVHDLDTTIDTENYAVFGELSYQFGPGTRLSAGARWQEEKVSYTANAQRTGFSTAANPQIPTSFKDNDVTLKFSIQQDFGENNMAYFTFSQGYKGLALDMTTGLNATTAALFPISPEKVDSYEFGVKADFFDSRMRVNIAAFLAKFKNFQAQAFDTATLGFRILNAGKVRSKGIEVESQFVVTEELDLTVNATFQDIEILNLVDIGCYAGQTAALGCDSSGARPVQNVEGATLPNAPSTKIYIGANYERPFGAYVGFANLNYIWQSRTQYQLNQNPLTRQGDYGIANLSIGARQESTGFKATVFINNLFDKDYVSSIRAPGGLWGGSTGTTHQIPRTAERTAGIRVGYSF